MSYRLKYDPGVEAVHDSLPPDVSDQVTEALADTCDDPIANSHPYGFEDHIMRKINTAGVSISVFVSHRDKTVSVLDISRLP
ncbi:hypothetical protein OIE69_42655 [Actinacidiphila glaucinigra]|uniref:hypothetical protein n=1 Tax=Actinacidiphila glaucinigra TaxID=235986 RepID=UPI002DD91DA9|nr:hypothetical protein [Actinacidiphila glaucinigra]WSD65096.1 hypothetical protein OIE69_42655 [Actinacidiphila glaucinigra]